MKTGDIRKLLINYYGGKKECIAVLLEETDTKYWFFSMDGTQFEVKNLWFCLKVRFGVFPQRPGLF